ncbi:MAG: histone deacetylase family protein [Phycisphaerae bacterium]|nr:histone deacetylase family protein [Phycisphaerae bacterium]
MIHFLRVHGTILPIDRQRVEQVQGIFRQRFGAAADYAEKIPDLLNQPFKFGYNTILMVSETHLGNVTGFSLVLVFPEINSALLDFLAVGAEKHSRGIGGALYEVTREYLQQLRVRAMYMEVLPDDPAVVRDARLLRENRRRLKFYEGYGVVPIIGTEYETPIGDSPAPYLLFDGLGRKEPLKRSECRAAMRLILQRKYSHLVGPEYIEHVVESVIDNPVKLREPRYTKAEEIKPVYAPRMQKPFALVSSAGHSVHHVRDRGYVERPARVGVLRETMLKTGLFNEVQASHFREAEIRKVHAGDFVTYLKNVCEKLETTRPVYPYVFPIRRPERRPKDLAVRAGYYCIDTFTPLDRNAYAAARGAVDVALTAAQEVLRGRILAYAVCRPPGHHAERRVFGGFCYFNNAAIAAEFLSAHGKVAVLDIDFHHGNGTQDIFYERADVFTVSIHGHPNFAYPYFSGFADETGVGAGKGFNRNLPLPEDADELMYMRAAEKALHLIERFGPVFLVVCAGFDIMKGDPTGSVSLTARSMQRIGSLIGKLRLPTLVVQEGGYNLRNLKTGSAALFGGIAESLHKWS